MVKSLTVEQISFLTWLSCTKKDILSETELMTLNDTIYGTEIFNNYNYIDGGFKQQMLNKLRNKYLIDYQNRIK
jgi:hypothetical protein